MTDWQFRGAGRQEHLGTEEWAIVDRLRRTSERLSPHLRRLEAALPRFAGYRTRLQGALAKVEDEGEHSYLSGMTVDSYHIVWWHLHQELLWALGISRADDPNQ